MSKSIWLHITIYINVKGWSESANIQCLSLRRLVLTADEIWKGYKTITEIDAGEISTNRLFNPPIRANAWQVRLVDILGRFLSPNGCASYLFSTNMTLGNPMPARSGLLSILNCGCFGRPHGIQMKEWTDDLIDRMTRRDTDNLRNTEWQERKLGHREIFCVTSKSIYCNNLH